MPLHRPKDPPDLLLVAAWRRVWQLDRLRAEREAEASRGAAEASHAAQQRDVVEKTRAPNEAEGPRREACPPSRGQG